MTSAHLRIYVDSNEPGLSWSLKQDGYDDHSGTIGDLFETADGAATEVTDLWQTVSQWFGCKATLEVDVHPYINVKGERGLVLNLARAIGCIWTAVSPS